MRDALLDKSTICTIDVFGRGRRVASIYANKLPQDSDFDDIMSELIASMNDDEPADEIELVAPLNEQPADEIHFLREDGV